MHLVAQPSLTTIYQGKTLSEWVEELGGPSTSSELWPKASREQTDAITFFGTNAIPYLTTCLGKSDSYYTSHGYMRAFQILGPKAVSAIPALMVMATNGGANSDYPVIVLGWIGPQALPALLNILSNSAALRASTLNAIASMGTNAAPAVPALTQHLNDPNEMVANFAISALGQAHTETAFSALTNLLRSRPRLANEIMLTVRTFKEQSIPFLIATLNDDRVEVRHKASNNLLAIAPESFTNAPVLGLLKKELGSPDQDRSDWAALVLQIVGQNAGIAAPSDLAEGTQNYRVYMGRVRQHATNVVSQLSR